MLEFGELAFGIGAFKNDGFGSQEFGTTEFGVENDLGFQLYDDSDTAIRTDDDVLLYGE